MTFSYRPAKLENVGLFIAIAGASRTGKTYTALRIARGIAGPHGRIAAIDTEGKRMSHYAEQISFDVDNMLSPFTADRFVEAAKAAQAAGYDVLVIDSFSLEWSGVGGVLHQREQLWSEVKYAQNLSDGIWNRVKGPNSPHRGMMNEFLQLTIPIIFCLRANEVAKHLGGGWKIEQDKRFLYEWTVGLTLHPDTPGMPRYDLIDKDKKPLWKVQDQHRALFPDNQLIGEAAGAGLQAWRNSAAAREMGSAAVMPTERPRTYHDWLAEIETELQAAGNRDDIQAFVGRDEIVRALNSNKPQTVARLQAMIQAAEQRVAAP